MIKKNIIKIFLESDVSIHTYAHTLESVARGVPNVFIKTDIRWQMEVVILSWAQHLIY